MIIIKKSEKVILWLHRKDKTQKWLADEFGVTRQAISQKIKTNTFSDKDLIKLDQLGFNG